MAKRGSRKSTADVKLDASMRIVVLHGPEERIKRDRLAELRAALEAAHGEVELFTFEGKGAGLADVLDELRGYSLMSTYKLVVVDEADEFLKKFRDAMERYAAEPVDHATLVLRAGTWNRGKIDKAIDKVGAVIKCEPMNARETTQWLLKDAAPRVGAKIDPQAAGLMVEQLGPQMDRLENELAKLALMVEPGQVIGRELVSEVVGRSNDEKAWAVQEAILQSLSTGSAEQVIRKVHELVDLGGQAEELVKWAVADLMRKFALAAMHKRAGASDAALPKAVRLWGPQAQQLPAALRKMGPAKALQCFRAALQADSRSKSGLGDAMLNLECFCVGLTDN